MVAALFSNFVEENDTMQLTIARELAIAIYTQFKLIPCVNKG